MSPADTAPNPNEACTRSERVHSQGDQYRAQRPIPEPVPSGAAQLVINAIRHGGGIIAFHSDIADGTLQMSVGDNNPRGPSARTATPGEPGGYGRPLVQHFAQHIQRSSAGVTRAACAAGAGPENPTA